jgi:MFS family permease
MGIYIIFLYGGNSVLSLVSGFVVQGAGWRWFCWLCAIISGLNFLAIFFFVHETRFDRTKDRPVSSGGEVDWKKLNASEKTAIQTVEDVEPLQKQTTTGTKKTLFQNLGLWSGVSNDSFVSLLMRSYPLIVYPAVAWGIIACE